MLGSNREGQRREKGKTFVNFVQLANRGREKRKKIKNYPVINLANFTRVIER